MYKISFSKLKIYTFGIGDGDFDFLGDKLGDLDLGGFLGEIGTIASRLDRIVLGVEMGGGDYVVAVRLIRRVKHQ